MSSVTFEDLDALSTEDLQDRAFALARERHDVSFFWSIFEHLPVAESGLDGALGVQSTVDDAVALWTETTNHRYGDEEPLIRAAFIDYLLKS
jgi:hypothetical protein